MRIIDIIEKKRDKKTLTEAEIKFVVEGYTKGEIPDYQISALLMAIYLNGMNYEETAVLTIAMANSGEILNLSTVEGIKVDKHSTGGVADTTTLILLPLVVAAGAVMAKMSGRGLGFTGGTIDKLESIKGFDTAVSYENFIKLLKENKMALSGQSNLIAPADGKLYALRDVTGTVSSIPLIASSIMSKKIAAGADKIVLDVKVGSGAFMKDLAEAIKLATYMVKIGQLVNKDTKAILTSMEEPLGYAIGNSMEVREAVEVLSGKVSGKLKEVTLCLGANILQMAEIETNYDKAVVLLEQLIDDKIGLTFLKKFITAQGGNAHVVDDISLLPQAKYKINVCLKDSGYVEKIITAEIGKAAVILGAGREYKDQAIDLAVGINMLVEIGDAVKADTAVAVIEANDLVKAELAKNIIQNSIKLSSNLVLKPKLILGVVDKDGFKEL
ncbi:MAG: thymidine phosphorylase [Negativicutes bacterium]|nr:thymidine phosphorylase [Negativicutes bacterium]MBP8629189.1 thymidine phosphorylase [Negativicutes bacterium]MBP9537242.1 thymidine phosphorylase [Negativicutes bacterium]